MIRLRAEVLTEAVRGLYKSGRGLSKPQIAAKAGLSHVTVFHILKGDQKTTLEKWDKLHEASPSRVPAHVFETEPGEILSPNWDELNRAVRQAAIVLLEVLAEVLTPEAVEEAGKRVGERLREERKGGRLS